jgi:hypothetical protein
MAERVLPAMANFHAHLDVCKQCRDNPFGLCKVGEPLLLATADEEAIDGAHRLLGLPSPVQGEANPLKSDGNG